MKIQTSKNATLLVPLVRDITILFRYCTLRALAYITVFYKVEVSKSSYS